MLLVQDQYVQNSRKNFESELQLKQNTSKQVFSDPKDIWRIESGCEEEVNSTGNDTEVEDNLLYADPSDLPEEVFPTKKPFNPRKKNVRFGGPNFNYVLDTTETSSLDNEYPGIDCSYIDPPHRRPLQDTDIHHKIKDTFRVPHKPKCRGQECVYDKLRPKSSPDNMPTYLDGMERRTVGDYDPHRTRKKDYRCGHHHGDFDFDDVTYKKPAYKPHKYGCGDDITRCCDHCPSDFRPKNNYVKMKPPSHKYVCHMTKEDGEAKGHRKMRAEGYYDPQSVPYHERYCSDEYCDHVYACKTKKKTLEAVQEQQEQFSDSTYKVPCTKYSSQTIPGEMFQKKRSSEKLTNSSQSDWLYYGGKGNGNSLGGPARIHKMRSRRTRMNRIKNGWKKAFVQTVRDGNRNERVGVIVMGSKGPEFYSKNSQKLAPFRRSKSFLDGPAQSFEVMTVDCKNVFLSSSEPGPRTNYAITDLVCPEDDEKVEEKIAKFSKNVNEIVKNSEEKFYKSLSEFPEKKTEGEENLKAAGEGSPEEKKEDNKDDILKYPAFHLLPLSSLSPRVPKSLRKPEKKVSEESKAMADALNQQAKEYLEKQTKEKESFLEELEERYSPKERDQQQVDANLALWGLSHLSECPDAGDAQADSKKEDKPEEKDRKDELSHTGSVKSTEQISLNKQRRKKYYESTTSGPKPEEPAKPQSAAGTPKTPKRLQKMNKWDSPVTPFQHKEADTSLISAVFRDLVENGCAISQEESENLQSIFNDVSYNAEMCTSTCSSEGMDTTRESKALGSPRTPKSPASVEGKEGEKELRVRGRALMVGEGKEAKGEKKKKKEGEETVVEELLDEVKSRKVVKMNLVEEKTSKKVREGKVREGKSKKKVVLEDRMKILREALPSIAAQNEATHLKQLKRYIDRFIDRVEASTASELPNRKDPRPKDAASSTDSSEIHVDARKILEFVSNPFRKISSDVTINIAKKLTDALVQDKSSRAPKHFQRVRKTSDNDTDEEGFVPGEAASSGSERCEEPEPTYLKQLKKMRNEHLNNIVLEVKRLSELLRFLDRCNRLHF